MKQNEIFAQYILKDNSDLSVVADDLKAIVNDGVDGICIYNEPTNDSDYENNLHVIKHICETFTLPIYVGGITNRLEDIKKYLYTGAKGVIVGNKALLEESVQRFGKKESKVSEVVSDIDFSKLKKNESGLVPCIVQDSTDGTVLMLAYMDEEAFNQTINTGKMTYHSRSRNKIWVKGEESGHFQYVKSLTTDCDMDTLLAKVEQVGVACHTGARSCFFNDILGHNDFSSSGEASVLSSVYDVILDRKSHPKEGSYTNYLFDKGIDKILKKVGEEATEIIIAAKNPSDEEIIYEIADFLYHVSVLMALKNVTWDDVMKELKNR